MKSKGGCCCYYYYHYYYYFGETKGYRGVGFCIKNEIVEMVLVIKGISEIICYLKLKLENNIKLLIIRVCTPTLETNEERETFYSMLETRQ